jgi:succinoglycan biosynthesis protein ExoO
MIHNNPEISIIIPTYNTEDYLPQALESVLEQTFTNFEIIVVDDASTDATFEIAKSYQDLRIRVLRNHQNLGAAATRNCAIKNAQGQWIALLDSDDFYEPKRLETLVKAAQESEADLLSDDLYFINNEGEIYDTLIRQSGQVILEPKTIDTLSYIKGQRYESKSLFVTCTKPLIRRQFLLDNGIEYDPELRLGQDYWFYLDCLLHGAKFIFYPQPFYYQRVRAGSLITQNGSKRLSCYCLANQKFLRHDRVKNNPEVYKALRSNLARIEIYRNYYIASDAFKSGQFLRSNFSSIYASNFTQTYPSIVAKKDFKVSQLDRD